MVLHQDQLNVIQAELGDNIVKNTPFYEKEKWTLLHQQSISEMIPHLSPKDQHAVNVLIHFLNVNGYAVCHIIKSLAPEKV